MTMGDCTSHLPQWADYMAKQRERLLDLSGSFTDSPVAVQHFAEEAAVCAGIEAFLRSTIRDAATTNDDATN